MERAAQVVSTSTKRHELHTILYIPSHTIPFTLFHSMCDAMDQSGSRLS
jgi:hypothetical protein